MLVTADEVCILKIVDESVPDNVFKGLDDVRCQRNRSVICRVSAVILLVDWCYGLRLELRGDESSCERVRPQYMLGD